MSWGSRIFDSDGSLRFQYLQGVYAWFFNDHFSWLCYSWRPHSDWTRGLHIRKMLSFTNRLHLGKAGLIDLLWLKDAKQQHFLFFLISKQLIKCLFAPALADAELCLKLLEVSLLFVHFLLFLRAKNAGIEHLFKLNHFPVALLATPVVLLRPCRAALQKEYLV